MERISKMFLRSFLILNVVFFIFPVSAENILFFFPLNSYSRRIVSSPLAEALASRGHNVTFISPHQPKSPSPTIQDIVPDQLVQYIASALSGLDVNARVHGGRPQMINSLFEYSHSGCEVLYNSAEFQTWLRGNPSIDLVIVDGCLTVECGVAVAHKLSAKYLVFGTTTVIPYEYDLYGYLPESSAIPELEITPFTNPMGFCNRVVNAFMTINWYSTYLEHSKRMDQLIRDKLGGNIPPVAELVRNVSLVFYTGDAVIDYPRALPPNHINIAGIHIKQTTTPIPNDIEGFLADGSNDGFVYISLGSGVAANKMPEYIKEAFFKAINACSDLKFLWKWDGEAPLHKPKNLLLGKWFPQTDLLAHEKIRAFVTQGGRPSVYEAIWNGVPMISLPIQGDQDYNVDRLENLGVAVKLEIRFVTHELLEESLKKVAYDSRIKERVTKLKTLIRDRQNTPLETAVWWTEYVLRTPNTNHLRPSGHQQSWYVRRQIDVWAFLTICFLASFTLVLFISKKVYCANWYSIMTHKAKEL